MPHESDDLDEQQDAPREREFQAAREREESVGAPHQGGGEDDLVSREADAAASEAARIGGTTGDEGEDEAARASLEHGGGEAEGFEQAEKALAEQAEHGESRDPAEDAYSVDEEARLESAEHGEPDEIGS
jgi:hypothetical protein